MNLEKIKSDIDAILKKHEENWMVHVFGYNPEMCVAFKEKQVCKAMYLMSIINARCGRLEEPEIDTYQEGWDLRFTWRFQNQYYLSLTIMVPWEGYLHYEVNTFEEGDHEEPTIYGNWEYKNFSRVDGSEVSDFIEHLKEAIERGQYATKIKKTTD